MEGKLSQRTPGSKEAQNKSTDNSIFRTGYLSSPGFGYSFPRTQGVRMNFLAQHDSACVLHPLVSSEVFVLSPRGLREVWTFLLTQLLVFRVFVQPRPRARSSQGDRQRGAVGPAFAPETLCASHEGTVCARSLVTRGRWRYLNDPALLYSYLAVSTNAWSFATKASSKAGSQKCGHLRTGRLL